MGMSLSLSRLSLGATRGGGIPPVAISFAADATGTLDTATPPAGYSLPDADQTAVTLENATYGDIDVDVTGALDASPGTVTENASSDIATAYGGLLLGSTATASGTINLVRDSDAVTVPTSLVATISGVTELAWEFNAGTAAGQITETAEKYVDTWTSTTAGLGAIPLTPTVADTVVWTPGTEGPDTYVSLGGAALDYSFVMAPTVDLFGLLVAVTLDGRPAETLGEVRDSADATIINLAWDGTDTLTATLYDGAGGSWSVTQTTTDPTVVVGLAVNSDADVLLLTVSTSTSAAATADSASITGYSPRTADRFIVGEAA